MLVAIIKLKNLSEDTNNIINYNIIIYNQINYY